MFVSTLSQRFSSSPSSTTLHLTSPPSCTTMKAVFVALALATSALAQGVIITQPPAGSTEKQGLPMTVVVQKQVRSRTLLSAPPLLLTDLPVLRRTPSQARKTSQSPSASSPAAQPAATASRTSPSARCSSLGSTRRRRTRPEMSRRTTSCASPLTWPPAPRASPSRTFISSG